MKSSIQFLDFPSKQPSNGRGAFHTGVEFIDPQTTYGEQGFTVADDDVNDTALYQKGRKIHTGVEGI